MLYKLNIMLHQDGSNNPEGIASTSDRIRFHPYFVSKDLVGSNNNNFPTVGRLELRGIKGKPVLQDKSYISDISKSF
jgi:hypothetical protein